MWCPGSGRGASVETSNTARSGLARVCAHGRVHTNDFRGAIQDRRHKEPQCQKDNTCLLSARHFMYICTLKSSIALQSLYRAYFQARNIRCKKLGQALP